MEFFGIAVENIVVGIASGGLVALFATLKRKIANYKIEKKYPIAGEYISKFEDENDGNIEIVTAPVVIKQQGKNITGKTKVIDGNRCWILEGEISSGGHLYGVYYAEDPYDKGIGNFFLYINYNKRMEGIWSGFDSVNQKITSGRYIFTPVMSDFVIMDALENDIPNIVDISDKELGKDYLNDDDIKSLFNNSDSIFRIVKSTSGEIVGFSYSYYATTDIVKKRTRIAKLPKSFEYSSNIGVLKTFAVKSKCKNSGIGTALVVDATTKMKEQNICSVITIAWKSNHGINIAGIMKNNDFLRYNEIPNYWKEDSLKEGYCCPTCGLPPCACSAVIFGKAL